MKKGSLPTSPNWSSSTKVIVTLLILAAVIALLFRFSNLITTLVVAFILAVLLYPIAEWLNAKTRIPWNWSVTIVYFFSVVILFGLLTLGGIAVVEQIQGLIRFLQELLYDLPEFFNQLTTTVIEVGPFTLDFTYINWNDISNQLLASVEPLLARVGNIIAGIASGTAGVIGSFLLSLVISFLLLNESGGVRKRILSIELPAYQEDFARIGYKINRIWNAFLRGQALVFLARFVMYLIILSLLRVKFVFGMALMATLGNFIPYIGVAISWITIFFVALFQGTTIFSLAPFPYALLVMGVGWILDNLYDTFFTPRVMADVLEVHPAAVMVAVLVGLNLFGILGMLLAAPTLATLKFLLMYVQKKLLDQNPWEEEETPEEEKLPFLGRLFKGLALKIKRLARSDVVKNRKRRNKNE